ncbi:hypothetical protein EBR44_11520 [bacterium]|nr:hypothetical protein [bacterium]
MSAIRIKELIEEIEERHYAMRAIEAPHWRWMAGMLVTVRKANGEMREMMRLVDDGPVPIADGDTALPVLEDPATLGCLLALATKASKDKWAEVVIQNRADLTGFEWVFMWMPQSGPIFETDCDCGLCGRATISGDNKIACLVAAVERLV